MTERIPEIISFRPVETKEGYLPAVHREVFYTGKGTPYLKGPGVIMVSTPKVDLRGMEGFLSGFPEEFRFVEYLDDPDPLLPTEQLCKAAGQLCYMSFGPERTFNKDAQEYFERLISSGHGSVLEHATFGFLLYGLTRDDTHELVRHRAGTAYSQVSQRYVSGKVLRFVEKMEYQDDKELHERFIKWIDLAAEEYEERTRILMQRQKGGKRILSGETKTDLRKKVQQTARSALPNETEAPIFMTANVRAWRHIINMRASEHAATGIRKLAFGIYRCLRTTSPMLFADMQAVHLPDGTHAVTTQYPKV
ncbi:MAG: FAD-dependent thymidylate synthase [Microgenomates group bacterium]